MRSSHRRHPSTRRATSPLLDLGITWAHAYWASGDEFTALAVADGAAVATLPDEVDTANATQATGAARPLLRAAHASFNGKPALEFDGTDDRLTTAAFTSLTTPNTVVAIGRFRQVAAAETMWDCAASTHQMRTTPGAYLIYNGGSVVQGGTSDTTTHLFEASYTGTAGSTFAVDGTTVATGGAGTNSAAKLNIGANNSTDFGQVDIAFIAIFDGTLTAQQRTDLRAWSQSFYATA